MFPKKNLLTLIGKHTLTALSVIIFSYVGIYLISIQIEKVAVKIASDRHLATTLSERTSMIANLKSEIDVIGSNNLHIRNAFIPANNILDFVSVLENLAFRNGVTQAFHFSSPTPHDTESLFPTAIISYQNTISSDVPTFINYLKEFEQLPYFTKIDSLAITSSKSGWGNASTISFSANVVTQTIQ